MVESTFLCLKCRNLFKIKETGTESKQGLHCPQCESPDITEAPVWAPLGSGINIFDTNEWEYECQECHNKFKMPIPKSPGEEKQRKCLFCGNQHLHRLTASGGEPLYCG